jgi:transposase
MSRWQAVMSIAAKIGCTPQTLNDWVKKAEEDGGRRAGIVSGNWWKFSNGFLRAR